MDTHTLRRLSGLTLILAGPLCILGGVLHPVVDGHAHDVHALTTDHTVGSIALLAGEVLLLLGLPAVYGWLAPRLGVTGLIGFVLYVLGNMLNAVPHLVIMGFAGDYLAENHPETLSENDVILAAPAFEAEQIVTGVMFLVGLLLLGIALTRAAGLPRWIGALAILGAILPFVPLPMAQGVTGLQIETARALAVMALGYLAWKSVAATHDSVDGPVVAARA
jgi:hypothetical protein